MITRELQSKYSMCKINSIVNIIFYMFLCLTIIPDLKSITILYAFIGGLTVLVLVMGASKEIKKGKNYNKDYVNWVCVFTAYSLCSLVWSSVLATNQISYFFINLIILVPTSIYVNSLERLMDFLQIIILATFSMCLFIILSPDVGLKMAEGSMRLSSHDGMWNANFIGVCCSVSIIICMYMIKVRNKSKILYLAAIMIFSTTVVMTGSRKSVLVIIIGCSLFAVFKQSKSKILYLFGVFFVVLIFYYILMSVPVLYEFIGVRIDSFLNYFSSQKNVDSSTMYRISMIEYGVHWFKIKPIFGHGMDNFRYLFVDATGRMAYSHNNYIELLVGGGLVGFLLYYCYLYKSTIKLLRVTNNGSNLVALLLSILITILCIDVSLVSYNARFVQVVICLVCCGVNISKIRIAAKPINKKYL